jgi:hypothetical protein
MGWSKLYQPNLMRPGGSHRGVFNCRNDNLPEASWKEIAEMSEEPNILEMALSYSDKKQWSSGESVWLWHQGNKGVFLKEQDGFVALNITSYREYLIVFWLNPETWSWEISRNLGVNYYQWMERYKESTR